MMHSIDYSLLDPTGNITILVETPVPVSVQPSVAEQLMEQEPGTEQVGFLSAGPDSDICLRMAGGEFCGNASMSSAALHDLRSGLSGGTVSVRVWGTDTPVRVDVRSTGRRQWEGTVYMPRPLSVGTEYFPGEGNLPTVRFNGITHIILERTPDRTSAEANARIWCGQLRAEAVGLMFYERGAERLTPLVYVPAAGTLCWENSCASGSSAVGAYLAFASGSAQSVSLRQPGGVLTVTAAPEESPRLTGTVRLLRRSRTQVSMDSNT